MVLCICGRCGLLELVVYGRMARILFLEEIGLLNCKAIVLWYLFSILAFCAFSFIPTRYTCCFSSILVDPLSKYILYQSTHRVFLFWITVSQVVSALVASYATTVVMKDGPVSNSTSLTLSVTWRPTLLVVHACPRVLLLKRCKSSRSLLHLVANSNNNIISLF